MKKFILNNLKEDNDSIAAVLCTDAFGMGANVSDIEEVHHVSSPNSLDSKYDKKMKQKYQCKKLRIYLLINQFGFRTKHSAIIALISLVDTILPKPKVKSYCNQFMCYFLGLVSQLT